jgi:hypothetical protein
MIDERKIGDKFFRGYVTDKLSSWAGPSEEWFVVLG